MDYSWVDDGLASLGLEIDYSKDQLPTVFGDADLTVDSLMKVLPIWLESPRLNNALKARGKQWSTRLGYCPGSNFLSLSTDFYDIKLFTKEDFIKFTVDDNMIEVAKQCWDATFVEAQFTHILLRDGTVSKDHSVVKGKRCEDVAKIMRWVYRTPMGDRELVSVYVTQVQPNSVLAAYFPVRGDLFPIPDSLCGSLVRSKLCLPTVDRAIWNTENDDNMRLGHHATVDLGGWIPTSLLNYLAKSKMMEAVEEEAGKLIDTFTKQNMSGAAFEGIDRVDGTTCT